MLCLYFIFYFFFFFFSSRRRHTRFDCDWSSDVCSSDLVAARDVLVARPGHLQGRRQVRPELEAVHASLRVALRHLLMEDPAAGGHPLPITGSQGALVTEAVTVGHRPREGVGDGFDPAMGGPGE